MPLHPMLLFSLEAVIIVLRFLQNLNLLSFLRQISSDYN